MNHYRATLTAALAALTVTAAVTASTTTAIAAPSPAGWKVVGTGQVAVVYDSPGGTVTDRMAQVAESGTRRWTTAQADGASPRTETWAGTTRDTAGNTRVSAQTSTDLQPGSVSQTSASETSGGGLASNLTVNASSYGTPTSSSTVGQVTAAPLSADLTAADRSAVTAALTPVAGTLQTDLNQAASTLSNTWSSQIAASPTGPEANYVAALRAAAGRAGTAPSDLFTNAALVLGNGRTATYSGTAPDATVTTTVTTGQIALAGLWTVNGWSSTTSLTAPAAGGAVTASSTASAPAVSFLGLPVTVDPTGRPAGFDVSGLPAADQAAAASAVAPAGTDAAAFAAEAGATVRTFTGGGQLQTDGQTQAVSAAGEARLVVSVQPRLAQAQPGTTTPKDAGLSAQIGVGTAQAEYLPYGAHSV